MEGRRKAFLPLLVVTFISALGFSIVLPILVYIVRDFKGDSIVYGLLGATYPFFQLIGSPVLGNLSDRIGRRKVLIISQLGTLLSWGVFLLAFYVPMVVWLQVDTGRFAGIVLTSSIVVAFLGRALDGLTGGNVSVAQAYLADISDEKTRKKDYAKMGMASGIGFVVGPGIAGLLAELPPGNQTPVIAAILISVVGLGMLVFYLPKKENLELGEQPPKENEQAAKAKKYGPRALLRIPKIRFIVVLYFILFLSFNIFYTAFPLHADSTLHWDASRLGVFFVVLSGLMALVQGPLMGWLSSRTEDEPLIWIGTLFLMGSFVCLVFPVGWLSWLAAALFALGNGLMWPSFLSVLSRVAPKGYQGTVQGLGASAGGAASVVGLTAGGFLFQEFQSLAFLFPPAILSLFWILSFRLQGMRQCKAPEQYA